MRGAECFSERKVLQMSALKLDALEDGLQSLGIGAELAGLAHKVAPRHGRAVQHHTPLHAFVGLHLLRERGGVRGAVKGLAICLFIGSLTCLALGGV